MLGLILFVISFMMVFASSYFLTAIFRSKKLVNTVIYFALFFISQIIIEFQILSLLKQINPIGVLVSNILALTATFALWKYNNAEIIDFTELGNIKNQVLEALKRDKILLILFILFISSSIISLLLALAAPVNSSDSMAYHLARIGFWLQNSSLAHFETSSIRQLVFPINSEILILWPMVFLKKDFLAPLAEYLAYWGCLAVLFGYLSFLKISMRRILWAMLILASLPAFIIESSSTQTNLIVGFMLFSSFYLFIYGIKQTDKKAIIFSAVAYALALGTKSTAWLFIPVLGLIYLYIAMRERGKYFFKPLLIFIFTGILAFLILSSYNYILNYIDYGNPFGPQLFIYKHNLTPGIKNFEASLIRYSVLFVNATGMPSLGSFLSPVMMVIKNLLFLILGLKVSDGLVYSDIQNVNTSVHENYAMYGLLGILLIIPLIFKFSFSKIRSNKDRMFYTSVTGLIVIGFLISISALMGFCYWYNRFFLTAIVLASPVLALSYQKRASVFKIIIVAVVVFNYIFITNSNDSKPTFKIIGALYKYGFSGMRQELRLREDGIIRKKSPYYDLVKYLRNNVPANSKLGLVFTCEDWFYPFFEENKNWKIYSVRYDLLVHKKNYNDYDFLVMSGRGQYADIFNKKPLVYNYTIYNNNIITKTNGETVIIYIDKDGKPVTSGRPIIAYNMIDFSQIPSNFKLIKSMQTGPKNMFFIFKKVHK